MKKLIVTVAVLAAVAVTADTRVEFRDCPKCDKRIRIDLAAGKAYVNLSRLEGASRDEVAARAARLLDMAKIPPARDPKLRPLMGWSSWNTFGVDISETIILETARALATNGLKNAGYTYVNIDDGFFWGHGPDGILRFHPERFPNGMKPTVDGIHALGLKAGIYSDAGADTCGSMWGGSGSGGKDKGGVGAGLYGHDAADCKLHFNDLGFDFIKVDYCGGGKLKLDEKARYTEIANAIKATGRTDVRLNLCRWAFPGTWAADIAESWRTTKDIRANWKSVKDLIGENLYLSAYARPGHYNDMDMLEVGQLKGAVKSIFGKHGDTGLTPDEELTHFGMWCMLSSPLLIGCDVRTIPASTKALITNPYLLAMNQNDLGLQGYVVSREGDACILVKDAGQKFGRSRYVALYNGSDEEHEFTVRADALDVAGEVDAFDLVEMADVGRFSGEVFVKVAPHATKFYHIDAERRIQRTVYEAESAFLTDYQELRDAVRAGTAFPAPMKEASGGMYVRYIGNRASNDLVWKDVKIDSAGGYVLAFDYAAPEDRSFDLSVDGGPAKRVATPGTAGKIGTVKVTVPLSAGVHAIRLSNATAWMPDLDRMTLRASDDATDDALMLPNGRRITRSMITGHRGDARSVPENTLMAFRRAVDNGFCFECDFYMTNDGEVYCVHDMNLKRTFGIASLATNVCWKGTLDKVDVGAIKGPQFAGRADCRVPRIDEVFALIPDDGRKITLEVKDPRPEIVPLIQAAWRRHPNMKEENIIFLAHKATRAALVKAFPRATFQHCVNCYSDGWRKGCTPIPVARQLAEQVARPECRNFSPMFDLDLLTPDYIASVHRRGVVFYTWCVDRPEDAVEVFGRGVDGICSNCPVELWEGLKAICATPKAVEVK